MKLTSIEERKAKLLKFKIPELFLNNTGEIDELEFVVMEPKASYFYFPTMTHFTIFSNFEITPIFDCGDTFYTLFESNTISKIVYFSLEEDKIYKDYGLNWNLLIMDVLWSYFDLVIEEDNSLELFCSVGEKIGFPYSEKLFEQLNITSDEISAKMHDQEKWKKEVAKILQIL